MAASVSVPVEEYLSTSYEPDREYVDGELLERHGVIAFEAETFKRVLRPQDAIDARQRILNRRAPEGGLLILIHALDQSV